ncbi:MAG: hypothetical protein SynsKO_20360 [Synoicihabitans sp.]
MGLALWIGLLRGHSLNAPVWNVDETIHSTIANVLLDGGVLYTDAIDQRSPLTYYATAAIFAIFGSSLFALRIFAMGLIIASAWFLGRTVWRIHGPTAGVGAAAALAAFSHHLLHAGDTFAVHTEWYVLFFTTAAAWLFFGGKDPIPSPKRCAATGFLIGLAIMSKQSALLELACPLIALLFAGGDRILGWKPIGLRALAVLAGASVAMGALIAPSVLSGAGRDLLYYTWTYNIEIYGAEFTFLEKLLSSEVLFEALWGNYPALFLLTAGTLILLLLRVVQFNPPVTERPARFGEVYLVTWLFMSTGAAAAGGRGFEHYFFPTFAPLAWLCVWALAHFWGKWHRSEHRPALWQRSVLWGGIAIGIYSVTIPPLAAPKTPAPPGDPAERISAWMKNQSTPDDRIFVWGFNPDIYHYTDRLPASRFVYCTFQTGLIPWTNTAPEIDTSYAIVPGAMKTLLEDLRKNSPRFIIDSSVGPHRLFQKYPIENYPELMDWMETHYAEVHPDKWTGHGFRVFVRIDESIDVAAISESSPAEAPVYMSGYDLISNGLHHVQVVFRETVGLEVSGLGLLVDGELRAAFTLYENASANALIPIEVVHGADQITLQPIVRLKGGPWQRGPLHQLEIENNKITEEQKSDFGIPLVTRQINATEMRSFFGGRLELDNDVRRFAIHAPATLTYDLPIEANLLSGKFGLPDEAYSPDNPSASDGAEFIIRFLPLSGNSRELFRRHIEPHLNLADQGPQEFSVALPPAQPGDRLELEITAGPAGVASSDWTYWADLLFETSL